jgi:hypothetical protein
MHLSPASRIEALFACSELVSGGMNLSDIWQESLADRPIPGQDNTTYIHAPSGKFETTTPISESTKIFFTRFKPRDQQVNGREGGGGIHEFLLQRYV